MGLPNTFNNTMSISRPFHDIQDDFHRTLAAISQARQVDALFSFCHVSAEKKMLGFRPCLPLFLLYSTAFSQLEFRQPGVDFQSFL